jgi:AraC family transcriptional regulator
MRSAVYRTRIFGDAAPLDFSEYHLWEREIAGCCLTATAHPARFAIPRHAHECASFFLVIRGSFTEQTGTTSWKCGPLSFVFTPPAVPHADRFHDRGGHCILVQLAPEWLDRVAECGVQLDQLVHARGGLISRLALNLYGEAFRSDALSALTIQGLILEILAQLARRNANDPPASGARWVEQAKELLHERFFESLTLEQIAGQVGVHPVHLATTFKRHFGQTVGQYIRQLRVEFAARKISEAKLPLSQIALAAGFCDHSHFSRTFKLQTGMTPLQYRQRLLP